MTGQQEPKITKKPVSTGEAVQPARHGVRLHVRGFRSAAAHFPRLVRVENTRTAFLTRASH
jgi:hypothetical protein